MRQLLAIVFMSGLLISASYADNVNPFKDQTAKESYAIGYQFGSNLKTQNIEVDKETLISAVRDAVEGKKPVLSPEDIREIMLQLRRKATVARNMRLQSMTAKNREEGRRFLEANKSKAGVVTLGSGLQYKILKEGNGTRPAAHDLVKVNYRGTLISGEEFDSTYNSRGPAIMKTDDVIKGWAEALQLMKAGSKWQIFVPADLAYGDRQFGGIPPGSVLIFELELLSIEDAASLKRLLQEEKPGEK
jgi:FKBP-type peptidyl-prolyl cis-trans isomerase FklB